MRSMGKLYTFVIGLTALLLLTATTVSAQGSDKEKKMAEAMQEMQERMTEARTPGEHHAALARFLGSWDVEMTLVMPGVPSQASKAVATYEWAIEGLWMIQKIDGRLMGAEFHSVALLGYDNFAKNHVVATVSSFDTALLVARGVVVDPEGKVTSLYGTLDEYTTGELKKPFRATTKIIDDDHHILEVWDLGIGERGAKVFEYSYSRKK